MSAARKAKVVHVVSTYPNARRRAYAVTRPQQPSAGQVNAQRFQLLEAGLADGLARVFEVAEALDQLEQQFGDRLDKFAVLLERVRKQAGRR